MELSAATLLSLSLVSLIVLFSLLGRKPTPSSRKRQPPGPRRLPFIGSLLHLLTETPQVALRDLARKHGPVMYLRLGQVDTVVISSPAAAEEVLRDDNLNFASRPSLLSTEIVCYGNTDIAFAPYGAYWRTLRRLCVAELLSARKVRQFAHIRDSEALSLVIQERFLSAIRVVLDTSGGFCIGDLFPSLRFVDVVTGLQRRLRRARGQLDDVFDRIIAGCEARRQEKKTAATTGDDDLLSVMLRIKEEGQLEFPIGTTNIKAIIVDLFTAGTETTSSTVEWIMSELMRNPMVMAKTQAEVRQTLDNKVPEDHEGHMDKLEYTKMVIKEGMRLHPVVPLLLPRVCRETCNIGGFEVSKGSRIMVNAWAIARSPENWNDANEFRPERFEDNTVDYNGTQFIYIPFGSGRRMCPGGAFGLVVLEILLARLLYYFDWSFPDGIKPDELDMDMIVGSTTRRRNQLHLVATPYNVPTENRG
ncbi:Cytochrome P450 99A2 [Triticum urartu]|uniref:Cytochrome P450 99A2 n=1 Tax=Triticum urartu TaxID=4572 RepID=M7Y6U5_TRIUA|nr:Cytochrome P450 99A2 [Triticum urartu]